MPAWWAGGPTILLTIAVTFLVMLAGGWIRRRGIYTCEKTDRHDHRLLRVGGLGAIQARPERPAGLAPQSETSQKVCKVRTAMAVA